MHVSLCRVVQVKPLTPTLYIQCPYKWTSSICIEYSFNIFMPKWFKIFVLKLYQVSLVSEFYSHLSKGLGNTRCGVLTRQSKEHFIPEKLRWFFFFSFFIQELCGCLWVYVAWNAKLQDNCEWRFRKDERTNCRYFVKVHDSSYKGTRSRRPDLSGISRQWNLCADLYKAKFGQKSTEPLKWEFT